MGQNTQWAIDTWQKKSGITPATGNRLRKLQAISKAAYQLIRVTELEISGIRDGDGYWHGSDAMDGLARDIGRIWDKPDNDFEGSDTFLDDFLP